MKERERNIKETTQQSICAMIHDASELIGTLVGDLGIGNDSVTKYFNFAMIDSPWLREKCSNSQGKQKE